MSLLMFLPLEMQTQKTKENSGAFVRISSKPLDKIVPTTSRQNSFQYNSGCIYNFPHCMTKQLLKPENKFSTFKLKSQKSCGL